LSSTTKIDQQNLPPILEFYKKVVLRLSEHGDVFETQTIILYYICVILLANSSKKVVNKNSQIWFLFKVSTERFFTKAQVCVRN